MKSVNPLTVHPLFSRFLFELSKITHYEQRLRTLHYKKKFNIWYAELKPKIVAVLEVGLCEDLKNFDTQFFYHRHQRSNVSIINSLPNAANPQQLPEEEYPNNKSRNAAMSFQSAFREICIPRKDKENGQGGLRLGAA